MSRKPSKGRYLFAATVAALAAALPLFLILVVFAGSDLIAIPQTLTPASEGYRDGITQVWNTSESLITITLTILGASVVWLFKDRRHHLLIYAIFVGCVFSLYFGIKAGFTAGLTLASAEPDLVPLLNLVARQSLWALCSGLALAGIVVFSALASPEES